MPVSEPLRITMAVNDDSSTKISNILKGTRVYLSGPMSFVTSREEEWANGWRSRLTEMLEAKGVIVFDPYNKPGVRGHEGYGREDETIKMIRDNWSFAQSQDAIDARAECAELFSPTMRIDLRMVDTSDFLIAYCPTNIYSVGTVHEIVRAREQSKPVLLVSPHIEHSKLEPLRTHLENDETGSQLLRELEEQVSLRPNPTAFPSCWYMTLVDTNTFFDGFGFGPYLGEFGWKENSIDEQEKKTPPLNPLLPYLEKVAIEIPKKHDKKLQRHVPHDDWLLWEAKK